jgi:hypothetical protein
MNDYKNTYLVTKTYRLRTNYFLFKRVMGGSAVNIVS